MTVQKPSVFVSLRKQLAEYGIKTDIKVDAGHDLVELVLDRNRHSLLINLWDNESIDRLTLVHGDKKFKQVVVSVQEKARTDNRGFSFDGRKILEKAPAITQQVLRRAWAASRAPNMPAGTKYSLQLVGQPVTLAHAKLPKNFSHAYGLQAAVPAHLTYFLIGTDEKHLFISALPKSAKTVAEAHKILLPKQVVGKKYVRQGEFFFVPVSARELPGVLACHNEIDGYSGLNKGPKDWDTSDHEGDIVFHISKKVGKQPASTQVVLGRVRNSRHKTLFFATPHWVYTNNEIQGLGDSWD